MAPSLLGAHFALDCGDCGLPIRVDAAQADGSETVVCPNCGFAANDLSEASRERGQRALIDRGAFLSRGPRRFEVVALRDRGDLSRIEVKRVVGLPGERIALRRGELYADGVLVRKSLATLREMAVFVHDDRFRPRDERLPPRWSAADGRWRAARTGYVYPGDLQPVDGLRRHPRFDWLTYHHWRCSSLPGLRMKPSPILDDYGYNLGPPRTLNAVGDVLLRCRARTAGQGALAISLHDGWRTWQALLWPRRGEARLLRDGVEVAQSQFPRHAEESSVLLEAAICDRRVFLAVAGHLVFAHAYDPHTSDPHTSDPHASGPHADDPHVDERPAGSWRPSTRPLAVGAAGLSAEVFDLVVLRDIHYLPPPGRGQWSLDKPLEAGEHLMLGDNAPISHDGRIWPRAGTARRELLGPVFRWPFAPPAGARPSAE